MERCMTDYMDIKAILRRVGANCHLPNINLIMKVEKNHLSDVTEMIDIDFGNEKTKKLKKGN